MVAVNLSLNYPLWLLSIRLSFVFTVPCGCYQLISVSLPHGCFKFNLCCHHLVSLLSLPHLVVITEYIFFTTLLYCQCPVWLLSQPNIYFITILCCCQCPVWLLSQPNIYFITILCCCQCPVWLLTQPNIYFITILCCCQCPVWLLSQPNIYFVTIWCCCCHCPGWLFHSLL